MTEYLATVPAALTEFINDLADLHRRFGADTDGLVAEGMSNREIAERLVLSPETVKSHVAAILEKLGVSDRTQAAIYAVRNGLVEGMAT